MQQGILGRYPGTPRRHSPEGRTQSSARGDDRNNARDSEGLIRALAETSKDITIGPASGPGDCQGL